MARKRGWQQQAIVAVSATGTIPALLRHNKEIQGEQRKGAITINGPPDGLSSLDMFWECPTKATQAAYTQ